MSFKTIRLSASILALSAFSYIGSAGAVPVLCERPAENHMYVDSSLVSSCVAAGYDKKGSAGNINGNPSTDGFLTGAGAGLEFVGIGSGSFTQNGTSGTFALDASLWQSWDEIAIGFKFGTGNQPDEWFVYLLNPLVSSGIWDFVNMHDRGGGLSHVQLYGRSPVSNVPEPGTLALFGVALLGAGLARRRKQG